MSDQELVTTLQNLVRATNSLQQTLESIETILASKFPEASASLTPTANAGAGTLPAAPEDFLTITVNGVARKVPLYLP